MLKSCYECGLELKRSGGRRGVVAALNRNLFPPDRGGFFMWDTIAVCGALLHPGS